MLNFSIPSHAYLESAGDTLPNSVQKNNLKISPLRIPVRAYAFYINKRHNNSHLRMHICRPKEGNKSLNSK